MNKYVVTTTSRYPTLPNEVQDRTLDFLHDSKPSLKACALVCRAWVPTSRYHLFSTIKVHSGNSKTLEKLFKSPNCTIRSCMHLTCADPMATMKIGDLLQHLTPSSLFLHYISRDGKTFAPIPTSSSVQRLRVVSGYFDDVADLFVTFPNVRELYIIGCALKSQSNRDGGDNLVCPPGLHSLGISACAIERFLRSFLERRIATNLLSIRGLGEDDIPIVAKYFSMFGNTLRDIQIGFSPDDIDDGDPDADTDVLARFCDDAGLQYLTGLQDLTIDTTYYYRRGFSTHDTELLASILDKIPSSTVKQLILEIPTPLTSPRVKQWHRIGEVLQQRKFSQLTEVIFEVEGYSLYDLVESRIREDLYMLEERRILSVRHQRNYIAI